MSTQADQTHRYTAAFANEIETAWQRRWEDADVFIQPNPGEPGWDASRPKFYCLDMFPYPSGAGLHVGHPEGYTATDIICRYKKMQGFNVLHPMGWDAFGLPAEQYAIQTGVHPVHTTRKAIDNFRRQLKRFGFCYDWSREFGTIDEDYYRWTQWIFLKIYDAWYDTEHDRARPIDELIAEFESSERPAVINPNAAEYSAAGSTEAEVFTWSKLDDETRRAIVDSYRLAYIAEQTVNWCPKLGTALANEEVIDGVSERGGFPVFRKPLRQWQFRITAYAERLLRDLDGLDWPASTRTQQAEWIGRSEGAHIDFELIEPPSAFEGVPLRVFTTRPDTVFGATYMVVAPEHPLVDAVLEDRHTHGDHDIIARYAEQARNRSDVDRQESKQKSGVPLGIDAVNPATGEPIPVWVADYVLMGYGTGAIMAVPGQDERDWEFAETYDLPIVRTVQPPEDWEGKAFTGDGPAINSAFLDGLGVAEAKAKIIDWLETQGKGRRRVQYKLRDWLFSRQRYWGEPFPIVFDERGIHHGVDETALPVVLPPMEDYHPEESEDPQPLLAKAHDWVHTTAGEAGVSSLPPDARLRRETNTMPGWAGSCWYYLRYCDPKNRDRFVGEDAEQMWMLGRSALRADCSAGEAGGTSGLLSQNALSQWVRGEKRAPRDFVPRDPYPEGTFGPAEDLMVTVRRLPHYEMPKATYFVTWRSRPGLVLNIEARSAVLESLLHHDGRRSRVFAACVMPDHVHWVVRPHDGTTLGDLVSSVKRFSAVAVNRLNRTQGSVWEPDRFDHIIRDERWFDEFIRYVVENPVKDGEVEEPEQYAWTFIHPAACGEDWESKATGSESRGTREVGSESRPTRGGVDLYVGGAEHAVLHLLYARFWHKVLFDLGEVSTPEPFQKLFHQGLILSHAYQRADKSLVPVDEVENRGTDEAPEYVETATGQPVTQIVAKMSKSLRNVVNPDDVIERYGADTFRLYEMYMGPLEASKPWDTRAIEGMFRFLRDVWRLCIDERTGEPRTADTPDATTEKLLHRTIARVGRDVERLAFNTAIAAMIEFKNAATPKGGLEGGAPTLTTDQMDRFTRILAPFAPHLAEEVWSRLGLHAGRASIVQAAWPTYDESMLTDDEVEIPVQILGKVRGKITVPATADRETLEKAALADERIKALLEGKTVKKVIVVPGRLVNIVAG